MCIGGIPRFNGLTEEEAKELERKTIESYRRSAEAIRRHRKAFEAMQEGERKLGIHADSPQEREAMKMNKLDKFADKWMGILCLIAVSSATISLLIIIVSVFNA